MQALKNLFARPQVQAATAPAAAMHGDAAQPTELSPEALALVGGGLPRVGGLGGNSAELPPADPNATTLASAG